MKGIPFTQYLRPNGRRVQVAIERPADIEEKASDIIAYGWRFECEELMDGTVSLTVADVGDDIDIELVRNGPGVPDAVDRLVERVHYRMNMRS